MCNSVREQFAYRIRFIAVGVVLMETINAAAVFEDVATQLLNGIPQITAICEITSTRIDKELYPEFESLIPFGNILRRLGHFPCSILRKFRAIS